MNKIKLTVLMLTGALCTNIISTTAAFATNHEDIQQVSTIDSKSIYSSTETSDTKESNENIDSGFIAAMNRSTPKVNRNIAQTKELEVRLGEVKTPEGRALMNKSVSIQHQIENEILAKGYSSVEEYNNQIGSRIAIDGIWGPASRSATKSFQRSLKMSQDGIIGKHTWAYLIEHLK